MRSPVCSRDAPTFTMRDHERHYRPLLFSKCQELVRNLAYRITITRNIVREPEAKKDREQKQRVFRRLSKRSACSISRRARSTAAFVSGATYPLTYISGVMTAT